MFCYAMHKQNCTFETSKLTCQVTWLPWWLNGKDSMCNAGDLSLIPGSGRSLGEGDGYPLQYSYLENSMDRGAW